MTPRPEASRVGDEMRHFERPDRAAARVMFLYLGRRGPMSRLTLEILRAAHDLQSVDVRIGLSRQNESFAGHYALEPRVFVTDTFSASIGAITHAWRLPQMRRRLRDYLAVHGVHAVVDMMPHVWSPFLVSAIKDAGARYLPIVHDVDPHPGDVTGLVTGWTRSVLGHADQIITLSATVSDRLGKLGIVPASSISTVFLPDLIYASSRRTEVAVDAGPLRLLFLGRIMAYKGLSIFLDAVDDLRARGLTVEAGVFGEGHLGADAERLRHPDTEVVNRWLTEPEIADAMARYHVVVASHIEASQSGVVATAFGACRPVVVTPVGGLVDQVEDGVTGMIAESVTGAAVADAVRRLTSDLTCYRRAVANIENRRRERSVEQFVLSVAQLAVSSVQSGE